MAIKKGLGKGLDSLISGSYAAVKESKPLTEGTGEEKKVEQKPREMPAVNPEGLEEARLVKITDIERNKKQPRKNFSEESLQELAESIRQFGVLQPLLVKQNGSRYIIVAGERRWRAAKLAGLKEIPVLVKDYTDQEIMEISLIENIQREDLDVIEEAMAYRRLIDEFSYRQEDLAAKISKSRAAITNRLRLLKLPEKIQELLKQGELSEGHARALLALESAELQEAAAEQILRAGLSVRETERLVKRLQQPAKETPPEPEWQEDSLIYEKLTEELQNSIGSKVQIQRKGRDKGRIAIDYYSIDELERICDLLNNRRL